MVVIRMPEGNIFARMTTISPQRKEMSQHLRVGAIVIV